MKKFTLVTITFLLNLIICQAQNYKFGEVTADDFKTVVLNSDKEDALYLLKKVSINFLITSGNGLSQQRNVHERILINNEDGLRYANQVIRLYNRSNRSKELIRNLSGFTYNIVDGKVVKEKLKDDAIFKEEVNDYWKKQTFVMPNVRIGSIIEFKYFIDSPYTSIDDIILQEDVPIAKLDLSVELLKYYNYSVQANLRSVYVPRFNSKIGQETFKNIGKDASTFLIYSDSNIPGLANEPMSGNIDNFRAKFAIEIIAKQYSFGDYEDYSTSWEAVSKKINENDSFGKQLDDYKYFEKDLSSIQITGTESDVITQAVGFVQSKIKWNDRYGYLSQNGVKNAYKKGEGNIADVNLLLTNVLRYQGFDANPVLISTRDNDIPLYPTLNGFNYVVVEVTTKNNEKILVDASEKYSSLNVLPIRALNWQGRVIRKNGVSEWVDLSVPVLSKEQASITVEISDDLEISGKYTGRQSGHLAYLSRNNISGSSPVDQNKYMEKKATGLKVSNLALINETTAVLPLDYNYDFTYEDAVEEIGDKLYINTLLHEAHHTNPFLLDTRKLPVDYIFPYLSQYVINYKIPSGYELVSKPENVALDFNNSHAAYKYMVTVKGDTIQITATMEMNKSLINPEDYTGLKSFYTKIVDVESEKIVLKKV